MNKGGIEVSISPGLAVGSRLLNSIALSPINGTWEKSVVCHKIFQENTIVKNQSL